MAVFYACACIPHMCLVPKEDRRGYQVLSSWSCRWLWVAMYMLLDKPRAFGGATLLFVAEPFLQLLGFSGEEFKWWRVHWWTPAKEGCMDHTMQQISYERFIGGKQKAAFEQGLERNRDRVTKSGLWCWVLSKVYVVHLVMTGLLAWNHWRWVGHLVLKYGFFPAFLPFIIKGEEMKGMTSESEIEVSCSPDSFLLSGSNIIFGYPRKLGCWPSPGRVGCFTCCPGSVEPLELKK